MNSPEFARWKRAIEQPSYLNDALAERDLMKETHKLWLVVSLHESPTGDRWPSELEAWLRKDGLPAGHFVFTCESADQPGTERAQASTLRSALPARILRISVTTLVSSRNIR